MINKITNTHLFTIIIIRKQFIQQPSPFFLSSPQSHPTSFILSLSYLIALVPLFRASVYRSVPVASPRSSLCMQWTSLLKRSFRVSNSGDARLVIDRIGWFFRLVSIVWASCWWGKGPWRRGWWTGCWRRCWGARSWWWWAGGHRICCCYCS